MAYEYENENSLKASKNKICLWEQFPNLKYHLSNSVAGSNRSWHKINLSFWAVSI